jgi:hypothetical protein
MHFTILKLGSGTQEPSVLPEIKIPGPSLLPEIGMQEPSILPEIILCATGSRAKAGRISLVRCSSDVDHKVSSGVR